MRDKLNDEKYFRDLIEKEESNIAMFEDIVKKVITEKGEYDKGTRNGYGILITLYQKAINLLYSYGEDLKIIEETYKKLLFYYSKMWDRKFGYIELIKILSLAVLFEIDKTEIAELENKLISENFDDYLVNTFIKTIDSSWEYNGTEFEFPKVYDCLKPIFEVKKSEACELLKEYLQKKWYDIHKECAWYDSHISSGNLYCGYWSFEAGAIAKILNFDDSSFEDVAYYPFDLVYYKK